MRLLHSLHWKANTPFLQKCSKVINSALNSSNVLSFNLILLSLPTLCPLGRSSSPSKASSSIRKEAAFAAQPLQYCSLLQSNLSWKHSFICLFCHNGTYWLSIQGPHFQNKSTVGLAVYSCGTVVKRALLCDIYGHVLNRCYFQGFITFTVVFFIYVAQGIVVLSSS